MPNLEAAAKLGYITEKLFEDGYLDSLPDDLLALIQKQIAAMNDQS